MSVHIDISEIQAAIAELEVHPRARKLALVVPIESGKRELVREFLAEGPPFDLAAVGIDRHEVFLTDNEVVFVFGAAAGLPAFERILGDPEFWDVVSCWEHVISDRPRAAEIVFDWRA